jgi:hypothetical protein
MNTAAKIINQLVDEVAGLEGEVVKLKKENEQYLRWWLEEKERNKALAAEAGEKLEPGEPCGRD